MQDFIFLLNHWQTLVGALVGGIFAIGAALLVARDARRREEVSAAMLLIGNLVEFRVAGKNLRLIATERGVSEDQFPTWITEKLMSLRPKFSALFEASVVRVMPVHPSLASHLNLLKTTYDSLEDCFIRLERDSELLKTRGTNVPPRSSVEMEYDANRIARGFQLAEKHASCAETMLSHLVLGSFPIWYRIKWRLFPSAEEKECKRLLTKGQI